MEESLDRLRKFYDNVTLPMKGLRLGYRRLLAHYYSAMISPEDSVLEIGCGDGSLLELLPGKTKAGLDLSSRQIELARARLPGATFEVVAGELFQPNRTYDIIIISDTLNQAADCQYLLRQALQAAHPGTRLLINIFNSLWSPIFLLARRTRTAEAAPQFNWLTRNDVVGFLQLSGWDYIREAGKILLPVDEPIVAGTINRWLAPWFSWFTLTLFVTARPPPRLSDAGRETQRLHYHSGAKRGRKSPRRRAPHSGARPRTGIHLRGRPLEGRDVGSHADVAGALPRAPHQSFASVRQRQGQCGMGRFRQAQGEVLMILDADLTMPPEELPKFYDALTSGAAEFANGVRLVYPMEQQAMPFLNLCANKFFAVLFTWLLEQPVKDTLCGTKVLRRVHYDQIAAARAHFGNFDPFGDFDLLFGAARLNLKIIDIPIRYRERTYGETNISRWRHGAILLRMAMVGARKLKFC